ncbi:MAG: DinB family protein [Phycisphaerae bacterium]
MSPNEALRPMLAYNDWADEQILAAAESLDDARLDQAIDVGRGTLRRVLIHTWAGEHVWVQRWQGKSETKWPDESAAVTIADLRERFRAAWRERDAFLATLSGADIEREVSYRDSRGSMFRASLHDMIRQMVVHSIHHRAQIVNILRRLGTSAPELDYMMHARVPA